MKATVGVDTNCSTCYYYLLYFCLFNFCFRHAITKPETEYINVELGKKR